VIAYAASVDRRNSAYTPRGMADEETGETSTQSSGSVAETPPATRRADHSRLRRLHALSGALALGAFLVVHLVVQGTALGGGASYDAIAGTLARSPFSAVIELVFVALPLCFHAGYGVRLLLRAPRAKDTPTAEVDRYGGRRLWVVQHISAIVLGVFVLAHLWGLRLQRLFFGLSADALYTRLTERLSWTWAGVPWVALFYLVGIFAAVVHLANGLFAATAAWKIATSPAGRKRVRILTVGLAIGLFALGAATVIGIAAGTRLPSGADGDSAPPNAPCGTDVPAAAPVLPAPSR